MNILIVSIFAIVSVYLKKVNLSGGIVGAIISYLILMNNWVNFLLFGSFFFLGSLATKWKFEQKVKLGLSQENQGVRTWIHALANGGVPALFSLLAFLFPDFPSLTWAATAAIAAALSDTLSSELGNVYGKNYYNIINFKKGKRGNDGVVSLEGTLFGLFGSFVIALVFSIFSEQYFLVFPITFAGFIGNLCDSYLGATLQQKGYIGNHLVNFINTLFAAFVLFLYYF